MNRSTVNDSATRAYLGSNRGTMTKIDDSGLMQMVDMGIHQGESKTKVEHPHEYGFSSVALTDDGSGGGSSDGSGGNGSSGGSGSSGDQQKGAEHFSNFINGSRSHPICNTIADRRHRLKNMKGGETALYDDQTQQVHVSRDAVYVTVPQNKKVILRVMPSDKPQSQSQGGGGTGGTGGQQSSGQQYGQTPWAQDNTTPLCSIEMSKDGLTIKHPKQIKHAIVDSQGNEVASHTFDEQGNLTVKTKNYTHTASQVQWNKGS